VFGFLAKGSKFVPDRSFARHTCKDLLKHVPSVVRQINCIDHFGNREPPPHGKAWLASGWDPPGSKLGALIQRSLTAKLEKYKPHKGCSNLSYYDKRAITYLKRNSHLICVADSDKGLGDALIPRSWADQTSLKLLNESCLRISGEDCRKRTSDYQMSTLDLIAIANQQKAISPGQCRFLLASTETSVGVGSFRFRPKLHKDPIGARPVFNLSGSWIKNLGIFLCDVLAPIIDTCNHVLRSTDHCQDLLNKLVLHSGLCITTFDVENLYPSVEHPHLMQILASRIRKHYRHKWDLANFIIKILEVVFANQIVAFKDQLWLVVNGIATGLQPGVFIANIYLDDFDTHAVQALGDPKFFGRFVDDILVIHEHHQLEQIRTVLNDWHPSIVCKLAGTGTSDVQFLDISMSIVDCKLSHRLYRKPLALYHYVPFSSCHPSSVFTGVVEGELHRISRRCTFDHDFLQEAGFFNKKLVARGYPSSIFHRALRARACKKGALSRVQNSSHASVRKIFLKVEHSSAVNYTHIRRVVHACERLVASNNISSKFVLAKSIQKSVFRTLYASSWLNSAAVVGG